MTFQVEKAENNCNEASWEIDRDEKWVDLDGRVSQHHSDIVE
jgi:hypothetical protein